MFSKEQLPIFAARSGNVSLVRERVAEGADVNYYDDNHGSAFFEAVRRHHGEIVETLLSHGAEINRTNSHGQRALELALKASDDSITLLLLSSGAQLQAHALPNFKRLLTECLKRQHASRP